MTNSSSREELRNWVRSEYMKRGNYIELSATGEEEVDWICSLLLSKDSELREKMRSLRKKTDDELLEVRTQNDLWKVCGNNRDIGYNQALDNVLDLLNKDHE